jgi:hypothetical protein
MAVIGGAVRIELSARREAMVVRLNADPRRRAAASRVVNDQARRVIQIAREIARAEFKNRSDRRRPRPGTPHYVDSFKIAPNTQASIDRTTVRFGNTAMTEDGRPLGVIIEFGADPHKIGERGMASGTGPVFGTTGTFMRFPYRTGATRSKRGGPPGDWPTEFGEAQEFFGVGVVNHPGSPAFHIFSRAVERYRRENKGQRSHR